VGEARQRIKGEVDRRQRERLQRVEEVKGQIEEIRAEVEEGVKRMGREIEER